jgi:hypothetical protein
MLVDEAGLYTLNGWCNVIVLKNVIHYSYKLNV